MLRAASARSGWACDPARAEDEQRLPFIVFGAMLRLPCTIVAR